MYSKPPNHITDLYIPAPINRAVESFANKITFTLVKVHSKLTKSTSKYKAAIDLHHCNKDFQKRKLVMVHL